jgi:hypothetical protein
MAELYISITGRCKTFAISFSLPLLRAVRVRAWLSWDLEWDRRHLKRL